MRLVLPYDHILTASRDSGDGIDAILVAVYARGVRAVDIAESDVAREGRDALRNRLRLAGMTVASYHAILDLTRPFSATAFTHLAEDALFFGAESLTVMPGLLRNGVSRDAAVASMSAGIEALAKATAALGITTMLPNISHKSSPYAAPSELLCLLKDGKSDAHIAFHTGNMYAIGEDVVSAYRELMPHIGRIVLSDIAIDERSYGDTPLLSVGSKFYYPTPVSKGDLPMKTFLSALTEGSYTGDLVLSLYLVDDMARAIADSLDSLHALAPDAFSA